MSAGSTASPAPSWSAPGRSIESVAAGVRLRCAAGDAAPLDVLVETLRPARVLEIGSSAGACAATTRAALGDELEAFLGIDAGRESCAQACARTAGDPGVHHHHASLLGVAGVPHLTRVPALVEALRGDGFDLIVVRPPVDAGDLYLTLAQALPLLEPAGVLHCGPLAAPGAVAVVRRLADEGSGPGVLWEPADGAAPTLLLCGRRPRSNHEQTAALRTELLATDGELAGALAAGDHAAVCAHLRTWLAHRLAWSTRDLLLPLGALPPPLSVVDVVADCALGEGGVWAYGAAVTLAMLYRAFGYPATVYQHGVGDLYWHMVTLVRVPDGRILVEDAFFDAEPCLGGEPVPWPAVMTLARAGRADVLEFTSGPGASRLHLYSLAGLPATEADGYITSAERAALAAAMTGCRRVRGEPRAALAQTVTTSVEAFARIPVNARALAELQRRTGICHPLGLLALPCGRLPLSGDADFDREIVETMAAAPPAVSLPEAVAASA